MQGERLLQKPLVKFYGVSQTIFVTAFLRFGPRRLLGQGQVGLLFQKPTAGWNDMAKIS